MTKRRPLRPFERVLFLRECASLQLGTLSEARDSLCLAQAKAHHVNELGRHTRIISLILQRLISRAGTRALLPRIELWNALTDLKTAPQYSKIITLQNDGEPVCRLHPKRRRWQVLLRLDT